ncbi:hypothetical protein QBC47DRAFT_465001 [Echria macrotheca]|uniref:Uncharacterized protein n=1 Tax=Echria macrotheca TaxID=438768 RepID=A0AAJ0F0L2_9PEZI|nr:hypothetical protein QBC47DRAFT_465001 [Echria macrotheca]
MRLGVAGRPLLSLESLLASADSCLALNPFVSPAEDPDEHKSQQNRPRRNYHDKAGIMDRSYESSPGPNLIQFSYSRCPVTDGRAGAAVWVLRLLSSEPTRRTYLVIILGKFIAAAALAVWLAAACEKRCYSDSYKVITAGFVRTLHLLFRKPFTYQSRRLPAADDPIRNRQECGLFTSVMPGRKDPKQLIGSQVYSTAWDKIYEESEVDMAFVWYFRILPRSFDATSCAASTRQSQRLSPILVWTHVLVFNVINWS